MADRSPHDRPDRRLERPIGPYHADEGPIVSLRPWNPWFPAVAAHVADLIQSRLSGVAVEHIGSTAVPGCDGKGIIDLMVLYPDGALEAVKAVLAGLGFQPQSEGFVWPEERPMREGSIRFGDGLHRLHVHVLRDDSAEVETLRAFRDRLRADARLLREYVDAKTRIIASGVSSRGDYTRLKSEFVRAVLAGAAPD